MKSLFFKKFLPIFASVASLSTPIALLSACGQQGLSYDITIDGKKDVTQTGSTSFFLYFTAKSKTSRKYISGSLFPSLNTEDLRASTYGWLDSGKIFVHIILSKTEPPTIKKFNFDITLKYRTAEKDSDKEFDESIVFSGCSFTYNAPESKGSIYFDDKGEKDKTISKSGSTHFVDFKFMLSKDCNFSQSIFVTFNPEQHPKNLAFTQGNPDEFRAWVEEEGTEPNIQYYFNVQIKFENESEQTIGEKVEFSKLVFTCSNDARKYTLDPNTVLSVTLVD